MLATSTVQEKANLGTLPTELIERILIYSCGPKEMISSPFFIAGPGPLYLCNVVCLALTCRRFWAIFKNLRLHEGPIPLNSCNPIRGEDGKFYSGRDLASLLHNWVGKHKYEIKTFEFLNPDEVHPNDRMLWLVFLSASRYSDKSYEFLYNGREQALQTRLHEWQLITFNSMPLLPHPHGLGDDWYPVAAKTLQEQVEKWPASMENWDNDQTSAWKTYEESTLAHWLQIEMRDAVSKMPDLPYDEMRLQTLLSYDRKPEINQAENAEHVQEESSPEMSVAVEGGIH